MSNILEIDGDRDASHRDSRRHPPSTQRYQPPARGASPYLAYLCALALPSSLTKDTMEVPFEWQQSPENHMQVKVKTASAYLALQAGNHMSLPSSFPWGSSF